MRSSKKVIFKIIIDYYNNSYNSFDNLMLSHRQTRTHASVLFVNGIFEKSLISKAHSKEKSKPRKKLDEMQMKWK